VLSPASTGRYLAALDLVVVLDLKPSVRLSALENLTKISEVSAH
jgi:hypothetical protein